MINDSIEYKDTVQNAYHLRFPFYPDHEQPLDPRRDCLLPRMMVPCIRLLANCEKMEEESDTVNISIEIIKRDERLR